MFVQRKINERAGHEKDFFLLVASKLFKKEVCILFCSISGEKYVLLAELLCKIGGYSIVSHMINNTQIKLIKSPGILISVTGFTDITHFPAL